jgi:8-amino-7-oxononanoate synthase
MVAPLDWLKDALADLDARGLRRTLTARQSPQRGDRIEIDGQSLVNFGSNDYLGLASDSRIVMAVRSAIGESGWGAGASPLVTGRSDLNAALERELAAFEGAEAALLFPTGYAANVGAITALVGQGDAVFSDELNHASIVDGCRLSRAAIHVYRHGDMDHLNNLLRKVASFRRKLIVTDSVFSMGGDIAPLRELATLAREFGAMLLVDEAHATGVFGALGCGMCEQVGIDERGCIQVGTLSKALGSMGGFVAGSQRLIDWLSNRARPYIFSTASPAAMAAAGLAALEMVRREPERREKLLVLAAETRRKLTAGGLGDARSASQIIPVVLGDPARALAASARLRERGYFVPAIRPPSVPEGQSLLRISLTALHTDDQISGLVAELIEVTRQS